MKPQPEIAVFNGPRASGVYDAKALKMLKIPFRYVTKNDLIKNRLEGYKAILFGAGHSIQVGPVADRNVKAFVQSGGGFLGICAGEHYGVDLGLLPVDLHYFRGAGEYDIRVIRKHPVTRGYGCVKQKVIKHKKWSPVKYSSHGRIHVRRANGGFLIKKRPTDCILCVYDDLAEFGAIAAGDYGKGRVVLSSPHPELSYLYKPNHPNYGKDGFRLFENAVKWISGKTN